LRGIRPAHLPPANPDTPAANSKPADSSANPELVPAKALLIVLGTDDGLYRYSFDLESGLTYQGSLPSPDEGTVRAPDPELVNDPTHTADQGPAADRKTPPEQIAEDAASAKRGSDAGAVTRPPAPPQDDAADQHPSGLIYHWKSHALLRGVSIQAQAIDVDADRVQALGKPGDGAAVVGAAIEGARALLQAIGTTTSEGRFELGNLPLGRHVLKAERSLSDADTGTAVSATDALAALKLSVGLNPNADPDGDGPLKAPAVSPFQYLAADVDGDGRVSAADALGILKMAVKRADAPQREWLFVDEAQGFGNSVGADGQPLFAVSRNSVPKAAELAPQVEAAAARVINLVALLKGDVTGNWSPEPDASTLPSTYFDGLTNTLPLMVSTNPVVL
jgi:hypothetical protein